MVRSLRGNTFTPWTNGTKLSTSDNWGFTWFTFPLSFSGVNKSGHYLIENNCDAYIFITDTPISSETWGQKTSIIVPPFGVGIYDLGTDVFNATCMCAGYDFTSTRVIPGPDSAFLTVRGPQAFVRVTSLDDTEQPSVQPSLRNGYIRVYDMFDLNNGSNAPFTLTAGETYHNEFRADITGAKNVTAQAIVKGVLAGGTNVTLQMLATSFSSSDPNSNLYPLGSDMEAVAANTVVDLSASLGSFVGVGPFISLLNTGANDVTVQDMQIIVSM